MAAFGPLGSAYEGHGPRLRLLRMCVAVPTEFKDNISAQLIFKKCMHFSPAKVNNIKDVNKPSRSWSRSSLIDSDSDFDSWLVATTPGDSDSDSGSDSEPLVCIHMLLKYRHCVLLYCVGDARFRVINIFFAL